MQTYKDVAACACDSAGGFSTSGGVTSEHPNVVSNVRNGKGDYTITISDGIDVLDALPAVLTGTTLATGGEVAYTQLTDTTFSIKFFDNAGAAQDQNFWFSLRRMGVGNT